MKIQNIRLNILTYFYKFISNVQKYSKMNNIHFKLSLFYICQYLSIIDIHLHKLNMAYLSHYKIQCKLSGIMCTEIP
ncbi:hypothetical protein pb186bvf_001980 [Paramecium bursaria]